MINIHKTKEGKSEEYESILQLNFGNVIKEMLNVFDNKEENIFNYMLQNLKPVNFTEKEFENCHIIPNNIKQEFTKIAQHTKRKITIPKEGISEIDESKAWIKCNDAQEKTGMSGLVYDDEKLIGCIVEHEDKYAYFPLTALENSNMAKVLTKLISDNST